MSHCYLVIVLHGTAGGVSAAPDAHISAIPRPYLGHTSATPRLHLGCISTASLGCMSAASRLHLGHISANLGA
eukprot:CAMPEP_0202741028 /NCGR_PEP_ID=MMETSP1388-20130828/3985_1 /ASSEMBLY_ACC=CAM_ASM_000864 /TAXON_ID=37098 /ORGANISM="Isochrysis sp, Strain CCMP1244" /LENGTH=72 /DNA_ID=CAMNT_0049407825 /DNA_START=75 /DNA_END=293 /DNA_ORIENTATION=+